MVLEISRTDCGVRPVPLAAISESTGISRGYLEELARPLKMEGLLRGKKGHRGGYELGRPAAQITVCDVVEALIGPVGVSECVTDASACERSNYCECRLVFNLVSLQMKSALQALTLADLSNVRILERVRQEFFQLTEADSWQNQGAPDQSQNLPIDQ
jgi:Rrf2 family protein